MADIDDFDDEEERKRRSAASAPEFTAETIAADIWTAVYYGIPLDAGPDLLRQTHTAAMQCAGAVAGPPGLSVHAFEPMQGGLGADKSREENFEHAVRRIDELNSRLRPAMLDDEAERQAPELQPAAEKEPLTVEAIERDTWAAVDRDIPADADRAFLATVAVAAEQCEKFAGAAARVGEVMEPELVEFYQERRADAAERRDEAWLRFTTLAPEQSSQMRLLNPEQMQDRAMSSLHEQAHEPREAAGQGAEITHETLDKNPWVVLSGVLSEFDDRALLDRIGETASDLKAEATQRSTAADSREEAELWKVVAVDAENRRREAREISDAERQAPEQEPAAEKEQIDPWIMAASADLSLSNDAQHAGSQLFEEFDRLDWWHDYSDDYTVRVRERERMDEANKDLAAYALTSPDHAVLASRIFDKTSPPEFSGPRTDWYVPTGELGMVEIEERASEIVARPLSAAELEARLEPAPEKEPMTIEAIDRDPSNAVKLDIPQDASLELLEHARKAAAHEVERIEDYIQYDREDIEDGAVEEREAAQARIAELDERLEPAISPTEEMSRPLGAAELAERVRRIIEDPSLADAERDDRVLQVVEERREEQSQAEAVRQDDAPQVDSSQEPETQSSADRDAAEVDWLFGREEMTEARAAAYDRFTGQELSPRTGQSAGPAQEAGQSQSHSKGRSR